MNWPPICRSWSVGSGKRRVRKCELPCQLTGHCPETASVHLSRLLRQGFLSRNVIPLFFQAVGEAQFPALLIRNFVSVWAAPRDEIATF